MTFKIQEAAKQIKKKISFDDVKPIYQQGNVNHSKTNQHSNYPPIDNQTEKLESETTTAVNLTDTDKLKGQINEFVSETLCQHTDLPVGRDACLSNHNNSVDNGQADVSVNKRARGYLSNEPVHQHTCSTTNQQNMINNAEDTPKVKETTNQTEPKKKATFYLSEKSLKQVEEMFVQSILGGNKQDKSALINEAIELLYLKKLAKP